MDVIEASKACSQCRNNLARLNFWKDSRSSDGLRSECIDCRQLLYGATAAKRREYSKAWCERNPEKAKESRRRYSRARNRRGDVGDAIGIRAAKAVLARERYLREKESNPEALKAKRRAAYLRQKEIRESAASPATISTPTAA